MKMKPHVIRQGEYTTKLASDMGFSAQEVWDHPKNAELKSQRKEMDVLFPGDLLFIPEAAPEPLPVKLKASNQYELKVAKVLVEVVFGLGGKPLADEAFEVLGLPFELKGKSGGDGSVKIEVPVYARQLEISFTERSLVFTLRVGDMDPIDERSGVRMRLANLGMIPDESRASALANESSDADLVEEEAIRAFQESRGLEPTGKLDDATKSALVDAHGS
jgi:N-acetylmuramoyl-L-alanine amidase